jgi:antitoxin component of MazEF toxin-antitoxin module
MNTYEIGKTWKTKNSITMIIPQKLAKEYKIAPNSYVSLSRTKEGILIKKLDI